MSQSICVHSHVTADKHSKSRTSTAETDNISEVSYSTGDELGSFSPNEDGWEADDYSEDNEERMRWLHSIGTGAFGEVFLVRDQETGEEYAAKSSKDHDALAREAEILEYMNGSKGFPTMHYYGMKGDSAVMVMDKLNYSLAELQTMAGGKLSLKAVLTIADHLLQRAEAMHEQGMVHRDIKPANLMVGHGDQESVVHVIDMGLATEYYDWDTRLHVPAQKDLGFIGSMEFASVRAHLGTQQSRRDDLESIMYVLIQLLQGQLPWSRASHSVCTAEEWYKQCGKLKATLPLSKICEGCPRAFETYLRYCRKLGFTDRPDYRYLHDIFEELLEEEGLVADGNFFD